MSDLLRQQDPETDDEWHAAVIMARAYMALHAGITYGLVNGQTDAIDLGRCREIVALGAARGIEPSDDEVDAGLLTVAGRLC